MPTTVVKDFLENVNGVVELHRRDILSRKYTQMDDLEVRNLNIIMMELVHF